MKTNNKVLNDRTLFYVLMAVSLSDYLINLTNKFFGVKPLRKPEDDGYIFFYCFNAGDDIWVYGYHHVDTDKILFTAHFCWKQALINKFKQAQPALSPIVAQFLIKRGMRLQSALDYAYDSLNIGYDGYPIPTGPEPTDEEIFRKIAKRNGTDLSGLSNTDIAMAFYLKDFK